MHSIFRTDIKMESIFFYVYVFARKRENFFLIFTYYFFFKKRVAVTNFHNGKKKAKYAPEILLFWPKPTQAISLSK